MTPRFICIHHTAVSYLKNPDQWEATDRFHKAKGWGGGGYNLEVSAKGAVHKFREDGTVTAAQYQKNMNDGRCISICLDGNFDLELPTLEQKNAVKALLKEKMTKYGIPKENVFKHRDVAQKTCPGLNLPDDIYSYFITDDIDETKPAEWAVAAWTKAKTKGVITSTLPGDKITAQMLMVILDRLKLLN